MEDETWVEALDVDDSDLPSLLRPCQRRRHLPSASPTPQSPPPATSKPTIPGPAGAVQLALLRKNSDRENIVPSHDNRMEVDNDYNVMSTQEYIRKAVDDTAEFDHDFTKNPWLSALTFLGAVDGLVPGTPISSIKKSLNVGKVDQVIAVIKSCTSNGLGGLIVTLKDKTGTIGASIHHKVLSESECGRDFTVGAAVILQKVAVFAPIRSAHYLNITLRNLVKVFRHDIGPPSEQNYPAYPGRYDLLQSNSHGAADNCGKASTVGKMSTLENLKAAVPANERRQFWDGYNKVQKENSLLGNSQCNIASSNSYAAVRKVLPTSVRDHSKDVSEELIETGISESHQQENQFSRNSQCKGASSDSNAAKWKALHTLVRDASKDVPEEQIETRISEGHKETSKIIDSREREGDNTQGSLLSQSSMANMLTDHNGKDVQRSSEDKMQRQPLILKPSLPHWTDEQLDELFADGDDSFL